MFGSWMLYVVFAAAVAMLLAALFWPKKREKLVQQAKTRTDEMGVRIPRYTRLMGMVGVMHGREAKEASCVAQQRDGCTELIGALGFNESEYQRCAPCQESWYGERIPMGKCPRCGGELVMVKSARQQRAHLRVSTERLQRLIGDINQRIRERA